MKRFFITSITLLLLHATPAAAQKWHKARNFFTLGASTGASAFITERDLHKCKAPLPVYTNGLYLRRYINRHLAIESGVRFSANHYETPILRVTPAYYLSRTQPATTNIPLAIQYYMAPAGQKLKPFVGVGCYYSIGNKPTNMVGTDNPMKLSYSPNNKLVPFFISQGFSYKLSPKIEINETIHFTPNDENNSKQLGIDIGFGFHL